MPRARNTAKMMTCINGTRHLVDSQCKSCMIGKVWWTAETGVEEPSLLWDPDDRDPMQRALDNFNRESRSMPLRRSQRLVEKALRSASRVTGPLGKYTLNEEQSKRTGQIWAHAGVKIGSMAGRRRRVPEPIRTNLPMMSLSLSETSISTSNSHRSPQPRRSSI